MGTTANKTSTSAKKEAGAKKPAAPMPGVISGKTTSGFAFSVSQDALDDYELFEGLVALDKKNVTTLPDVLQRLLGDKQKAALMEHCRDANTGRVSSKTITAELNRILDTLQALKK